MSVVLMPGDCLEVLEGIPENSVGAVVADPPYHLTSIVKRFGKEGSAPAQYGTDGVYARSSAGFMGKEWDGGDIAFRPDTWAKVLRVMKPGAHLVAFGAPKNYHRLACAIEDAGFEIRDSLMWVFGSGFPKSLDVSKAIDKAAGAEREIIGYPDRPSGLHRGRIADYSPLNADEFRPPITAPATDEAREWQGWGTALKPAYEPIVLARKPLSEKTVAANVLKWGTGALNIDQSRIGTDVLPAQKAGQAKLGTFERHDMVTPERVGRWPANLAHDGSEEVLAGFPETSPSRKSVRDPNGSLGYHGGASGLPGVVSGYEDNGGSAARFFYCAKASKADRAGSKHPTVKPVALMRWLVRLVTPPGGTVLDPFAGSGTTGQAAVDEGFTALLIEREEEYQEDIKRRLCV